MMKWRDVAKIALGTAIGFFTVEIIKHYVVPPWHGSWE